MEKTLKEKRKEVIEIYEAMASIQSRALRAKRREFINRKQSRRLVSLLEEALEELRPDVAEAVNWNDYYFVQTHRNEWLAGGNVEKFKRIVFSNENRITAYYLLVYCEITGVEVGHLMDTEGGFLDAYYMQHISGHEDKEKQKFHLFLKLAAELYSVHRA